MTSAATFRDCFRNVDGIVVPVFFEEENVREALNYEARPGDVFIATYPKCGTTWLQYIVWCLYNMDRLDGGVPSVYDMIQTIVPFIDRVGTAPVLSRAPPRCMKTHFSRDDVPYHPDAKYVVAVRNPFDSLVSFYHFCKATHEKHISALDFDEFFDCYIAGDMYWGSYFDHVMSWYKHRHDPNVCFLYYEELLEDPAGHVLKVADFLEPSGLGCRLRADPGLLAKVVDLTSFHNLKKAAYEAKPDVDVAKLGWKSSHFRKGVVGDWRNQFTQEQQVRLRRVFEEKLAGTEMKQVFERYLDRVDD
ncbi:sulfotransferase ssu-1-like [Ornithodoros turicata]|uniref:sulfotransferase ssu-1-like n=1 Tax=Ornithodoros turicata TaxID=34597 RepID=UPI0031392F48